MVYICDKCKFCFERRGEVNACVDCGHSNVRPANDAEIAEFERNKAEFGGDGRNERGS